MDISVPIYVNMDFLQLCIRQAMVLIFQAVTYFIVQVFEGEPHYVERPIDKKIPLVTQAIYIYGTWFPLIAIFPIGLYYCSEADYAHYMVCIVTNILVSCFIYLIYPTTIHRPNPQSHMLSGKILRLVYKLDYKGKNCMPSMHCSMCYLIIMFAVAGVGIPAPVRIFVIALSCGIVCSTVLTKQHAFVDTVSALPLAVAVYFITGAFM